YATGQIDVFDSTFTPATLPGSFSDPTVPAGYVPYNVQTLKGNLYVEYALKAASGNPLAPQRGAGNGFVRVYDANGNLLAGAPAISGGNLNAPWGVAFAPADFGTFSNDLLIGNFGNGMINAYDPTTGLFVGTIMGSNGLPLVNNNLWCIGIRTAGAFDTSAVYFAAGINMQNHCCPAINQTDSVGWGNRVTHWWRLAAEVPVKWAFSQKASRSESVESGRGSRPDSTACERWRPGRKRTDPNLGLDCVLAGTKECLDSQMLLDPLEEQLHLPAALVDLSDGGGWKREVIGEKLEPFPGFPIEIGHSSQCFRIDLGGIDGGQNHGVIGPNARGFVDRVRV